MRFLQSKQSNLFDLKHQITGNHADQLHAHSLLLLVRPFRNIYNLFFILRLGKEMLFFGSFLIKLHTILRIQPASDIVQQYY